MDFVIENSGTAVMPLGTAQLIAPLGSISDASPTFEWSAVTMATDYTFDYTLVIYNVSTETIVFDQLYTATEAACDTDNTCMVQPVGLVLPHDAYTWLIQASNATNISAWSTYVAP